MGPWLADTIRQCDGQVDIMSYWTFSDVFEEGGVAKKPFTEVSACSPRMVFPSQRSTRSSFCTNRARPKFKLTRRTRSSLFVPTDRWQSRNLSLPEEKGPVREFALQCKGLAAARHATIRLPDADHGSRLQAYAAMGSPATPTPAQFKALRPAAELRPPQSVPIRNGRIELQLASKALALIGIR